MTNFDALTSTDRQGRSDRARISSSFFGGGVMARPRKLQRDPFLGGPRQTEKFAGWGLNLLREIPEKLT